MIPTGSCARNRSASARGRRALAALAPSTSAWHPSRHARHALHAHHGEKPVILVDEYDSPINHAATHGFGDPALQFFRNFLSGALEDGDDCRLGVITGILRVAKEGVLSGLNNLKVYSVFDEGFADCFGFTEDEVRSMLATFGHSEKFEEAKDWYDGYVFGGREIYNPWSLLNYVDDGCKPQPYWTSTSGNSSLTECGFARKGHLFARLGHCGRGEFRQKWRRCAVLCRDMVPNHASARRQSPIHQSIHPMKTPFKIP